MTDVGPASTPAARAEAAIRETGVIAILRGNFRGRVSAIVDTLREAGIRAIEVTLDSAGALEAIETLTGTWGEGLAIGAGTVLDPGSVAEAERRGASFIVAPNFEAGVVEVTLQRSLLAIPGAFTPSEIVAAWRMGAGMVKVFPAGSLGPSYIRELRGPLAEVPLVPTGGVTPENAEAYVLAGATALGAGSALVGRGDGAEPDLEAIRGAALAFLEGVRRGRLERGTSGDSVAR